MSNQVVTELVARDEKFQQGLRSMESGIRGFGQRIISSLSGVTASLGLFSGIGLAASVAAAGEASKANKKLEAVLQATGGAAGYTGAEMRKMADSFQDVTNFSANTITNAQALLATFREIKGPVFKDAIAAMMDMSAVMDTDLSGAAIQVGKALNDPIQGMAALARVGVSFSEKQKEMIKQLQTSGDLMGAQKVILAELKGEFGGAAEAMAGPVTQAKNAMKSMSEEIGRVLAPSLKIVAQYTKEFADSMKDAASSSQEVGMVALLLADAVHAAVGGAKTLWLAFAGAAEATYSVYNAIGLVSDEIYQNAIDQRQAAWDSLKAWLDSEFPHARIASQAQKTQRAYKGAADAGKELASFTGIAADTLSDAAKSANAMWEAISRQVKGFGLTPERAKLEEFRKAGMDPDLLAKMEGEVKELERLQAGQKRKDEAKALTESVQTAAEKEDEILRKAHDLFEHGDINQETMLRTQEQVAKDREERAWKEWEDMLGPQPKAREKPAMIGGEWSTLEGQWRKMQSGAAQVEDKTAKNTGNTAENTRKMNEQLDELIMLWGIRPVQDFTMQEG